MGDSDPNQGLVPADLAGRFQVERPLGVGGAGKLFMAVYLESGERGLLKLLRSRLFRGNPDKQRLRRELSRQQTLEHPHLLTPDYSGEVDNTLWCFREYIPGQTLRERLDSSGPVPVPEAMALCAQIATALHALHEAGLVHRDVKPEHVVLHDDGSGIPSCVLIDSGIAAPIVFDSVFDVNGTPAYVSPEQVQGRLISFRSDLYALGCVFYEMVTGRPVFENDAIDALMIAHVQSPVPEPPAGLPETAAQLFLEMVSKRPRQRPESALEVFRRLSPLLTDAGRASVLSDPEGRPTAQRPSRPPPPPPPTAETLDLDEFQTSLGMPPPANFSDPADYPTIQPDDTDVDLTTDPPIEEVDAVRTDEVEIVPEDEADPGEDELESPKLQSVEPGPTTAEEAMNLDFDQLAESISGGGSTTSFDEGSPEQGEPSPDSQPPRTEEPETGSDSDVAPSPGASANEGLPDAGAGGAESQPAPSQEDKDSEEGSEDNSKAASEGETETGQSGEKSDSSGANGRLTVALLVVIGLALLTLWTIVTLELFGEEESEVEGMSDATVVYLYPEGGWYWQPDAAPEVDASLFAEEQLDLLAPLIPLDIDAGLAPDAMAEPVSPVSSDAAADGADGSVAADALVADAASPDAGDAEPADGGGDAGNSRDASPPDASVPDADLPTWEARRERARELYAFRDYERAREVYLSLVRERRDHAGSWAGLAACYAGQRSWAEAVTAMQQAIRINPEKSGYFASLGKSFLELGDMARARQAFERALELNPRNVVAIRALRDLGVVIDPVR